MVIMLLYAQPKVYTCVEEPESELESYPKKEETYNEDEVSEECDYYDGMTEGHSLVVRPLLAVSKVKGEEDWRRTSIFQTYFLPREIMHHDH